MTDEWDLLLSNSADPTTVYEEIVQRHYQPAFLFARQILADDHLAEDIVQKAFVNIYVARDRWERRAKFKTFLFRVVSNLAINELNRKRPHRNLSDVLPEEAGSFDGGFADGRTLMPGSNLESSELGDMITAALFKLPARHRAALYLREYQHMSYSGIADVLEASLNEVKIWIHRGRASLQQILKPYLDRGESIS